MKERVAANTVKVRKHHGKLDKFKQARMFQNYQTQFYREMNSGGETCDDEKLNAKQSKQLLGNIWDQLVRNEKDDR